MALLMQETWTKSPDVRVSWWKSFALLCACHLTTHVWNAALTLSRHICLGFYELLRRDHQIACPFVPEIKWLPNKSQQHAQSHFAGVCQCELSLQPICVIRRQDQNIRSNFLTAGDAFRCLLSCFLRPPLGKVVRGVRKLSRDAWHQLLSFKKVKKHAIKINPLIRTILFICSFYFVNTFYAYSTSNCLASTLGFQFVCRKNLLEGVCLKAKRDFVS